MQRQRARDELADHPGAHPRRGGGRPADRIPGKGAPGEHGGKAGDLYVRVHVTPHGVFGRSGDNLTVTVPVTITELALGADIKVPTHRGPAVTVRVPAGLAQRDR